jgi:signal transduction histidine kinase
VERFNTLKITFVFIITIILPSVFLSAFAYQVIEAERLARRTQRHHHLLDSARLLAHEIEEEVNGPARALREGCAHAGARIVRPLDAVSLLDKLRERSLGADVAASDTLCPVVLYGPDGRRVFPAPPLALRATDASNALSEARALAAVGSRTAAVALLEKLERDPQPATALAAQFELAQLRVASADPGDLEVADMSLEQIATKPIDLVDPLGQPVVGNARLAQVRVAAALKQRAVYQQRLVTLLRVLEMDAARLPPEPLDYLARVDGNLLLAEPELQEEGHRALALVDLRKRIEDRAERTDEVMSADVRALLAAPVERPLFVRQGRDAFVAAPLERADGTLVALALVAVDLDRLAQRAARDRAAVFTTAMKSEEPGHEETVFETAPASPALEGELDVGRQTLGAPLDGLQVIARPRGGSEEVVATGTTMKLWLIALSFGGVFAGAAVTVRTVVREAKAAELKSDFVTNVTHELRTPLTSIRMFIETLELGRVESEAEAKECLTIMARETDRLTRLIERLLAFSKIESRKWRFRFSYMPPLELVEEAIRVLRRQLQIKDGDQIPILVERVQEVAPVAVDKDAIVEVLLNLLTNAWKYTPAEGRRIRVVISERRRQVVIDVEDNGIGVPRRDRRRIWKKFERGSNAEKGRIEGSGIGLTLALSIAKGHGGTVTLTPLKQGSRFSLILPKLALAKPAHAADVGRAHAGARGGVPRLSEGG